jgi:hypothetical protein
MSIAFNNEVPGWYIEFQAALLCQAPRPGEIDQTTAEGWTSNQEGLKKNLAGCLLSLSIVTPEPPKSTPSILEFVSTVMVPATTSKFFAKDKFVVNVKSGAPVKISAIGDHFTNWFLSGDGKIEDPISEQALSYHKLQADGPIINELGGEAKAGTTLSEMFSLVEKQKNGEGGVLLNNGNANLFYIKDQNGVLRTVDVRCNGLGWCFHADSVGLLYRRLDGSQVFSLNSSDLLPSAA